MCFLPFLFMCVQVRVRFHSCSSVCKSVFASILVLVCAYVSVCSLPFLFMCVHVCVRFHSYSCLCKCVFASILVLL